MLCNICKKREAKIYYTEIIQGEKKEQHLCEECAAEQTSFFTADSVQNKEFFLGGLLAGLLEGLTAAASHTEKIPALTCECCGMTLEGFLKSGRFGCRACYENFGIHLPKVFKNLQGGDTHFGKKPKGYAKAAHLTEEKPMVKEESVLKENLLSEESLLKLKLQQAIEKEEYEEAARIRDRIRGLKKEAAHE